MKEYRMIGKVLLKKHHKQTGRTKHKMGLQELPPAVELNIVQFQGERECYLIHLDAEGNEITDTLHSTVVEAKAQAEWEYMVKPDEWMMDSGEN